MDPCGTLVTGPFLPDKQFRDQLTLTDDHREIKRDFVQSHSKIKCFTLFKSEINPLKLS